MTSLWMAPCNPHALTISAGSAQGSPGQTLALLCLFLEERAYLHRGRRLLPFFNNGNRSPENSFLCKPELAGCAQTNKQGDYHCSRRAVLMSNALVQCDSRWHRTRPFQRDMQNGRGVCPVSAHVSMSSLL